MGRDFLRPTPPPSPSPPLPLFFPLFVYFYPFFFCFASVEGGSGRVPVRRVLPFFPPSFFFLFFFFFLPGSWFFPPFPFFLSSSPNPFRARATWPAQAQEQPGSPLKKGVGEKGPHAHRSTPSFFPFFSPSFPYLIGGFPVLENSPGR